MSWNLNVTNLFVKPIALTTVTRSVLCFVFCWPCISIWLLVGDQLDTQFFYIIHLFQSSSCFEQTRAHHQEVNCFNTASGIVTLCKWPSGMQV